MNAYFGVFEHLSGPAQLLGAGAENVYTTEAAQSLTKNDPRCPLVSE
jgi:hypothetical protein